MRQVGNGFLVVRDQGKDFVVRTDNTRNFNREILVCPEGYQRNGQIIETSVSRR